MHPAYFETRFTTETPVHDWPAAFAIITAFATTGETWSEDENRAADALLASELRAHGVWLTRLTGYSPRTGHTEPGWAVALPFEAACNLGQQFRQDAIYFVQGDELFVSFCDARRGLTRVGRFRTALKNP
jgi:hypothetical protein